MIQKYLRLAVCLFAGTAFAFSQDVPQPVVSEQASSWVSRLWNRVFTSSLTPVSSFDPTQVPLYLPPPPPAPCLVKPLSPIQDELALQFEEGFGEAGRVYVNGLTRPTARALSRFERLVSSVGGQFTLTSAHRPSAYQQHLQEVWDTWMLVRHIYDSQCEAVRAEAEREFYAHGLLETQRPASISDHTRGTAFDARVLLPERPRLRRKRVCVDSLAKMAGLYRPVMWADPVHFRIR